MLRLPMAFLVPAGSSDCSLELLCSLFALPLLWTGTILAAVDNNCSFYSSYETFQKFCQHLGIWYQTSCLKYHFLTHLCSRESTHTPNSNSKGWVGKAWIHIFFPQASQVILMCSPIWRTLLNHSLCQGQIPNLLHPQKHSTMLGMRTMLAFQYCSEFKK